MIRLTLDLNPTDGRPADERVAYINPAHISTVNRFSKRTVVKTVDDYDDGLLVVETVEQVLMLKQAWNARHTLFTAGMIDSDDDITNADPAIAVFFDAARNRCVLQTNGGLTYA